MDDKELVDSVESSGSDYLEALMLFRFKKFNLETVIETINVLGRDSGLFEHEIDHKDGTHVITLRHGLGTKWSSYIGALINRFIKKELKIVPKTICSDETVAITFMMDLSGSKVPSF